MVFKKNLFLDAGGLTFYKAASLFVLQIVVYVNGVWRRVPIIPVFKGCKNGKFQASLDYTAIMSGGSSSLGKVLEALSSTSTASQESWYKPVI